MYSSQGHYCCENYEFMFIQFETAIRQAEEANKVVWIWLKLVPRERFFKKFLDSLENEDYFNYLDARDERVQVTKNDC